MVKTGFRGITGRLCEIKFKNLKATYKTIRKRLGQTGGGGEISWPYFDVMDDLLKNDAAVNPNNIAEAGAAGFNRIRQNRVDRTKNFYVVCNVITRFFLQAFIDQEEDDEEHPVRKRKRISNAETIELMMQSEAERAQVNNQMLEILNGFRQQGAEKLNLLKKIIEEKSAEHEKE